MGIYRLFYVCQGEYSEGGQSLLDAARLLKSQVRSVLSAEQEQHRLLLAQKQQHKQAVEDSSSSAAPAAEDDELDIEVQAAAAAISTLEAAVLELEDMEECVQAASSQVHVTPTRFELKTTSVVNDSDVLV